MTVGIGDPTLLPKQKGRWFAYCDVTCDNSYPTGGYSVPAASFGMSTVVWCVPEAPVGGYVFFYDRVNSKLKAYYADYDAVADGALIEVANGATGLNTLVVRLLALGY